MRTEIARDNLFITSPRRGSVCAPIVWWPVFLFLCGLVSDLQAVTIPNPATNRPPAQPNRSISYYHDVVPDVPWSIHVVKVERSHPELAFSTTLGKGAVLGMGTVSAQLRTLSPEVGRPLAAINGDYFENSHGYRGRPRDLQVRQGEVVSSPSGHACFWIDSAGIPHTTNVCSRFRVIWADGTTTPVGLNEERQWDSVVLYSSVAGSSTRTQGGRELLLEGTPNKPWLPLRVGQTYVARVRAVGDSGNTPLERTTLVLSIGPQMISRLPSVAPGATLQIITETAPDLTGAETAIGGGPMLVQNRKPMRWGGVLPVWRPRAAWGQLRHPRTALGWNKDYIFLVEVDGRQSDLSVGMTFQELAEYMVKLGCEEAMNLDGGGSATLWFRGSVRNSPSEGRERPGPNALVVVEKEARPN